MTGDDFATPPEPPGVTFARDLLADFGTHGAAAIARIRDDKPVDYVKLVMAMLPKEIAGAAEPGTAVTRIERSIVDPADPDRTGV